ncbi:MAG: nucleoside-diphosphate sugar epimerase/dehydratase [Polyangiaceae bacterium]|nr:nucleoside-diphosphate sugar epimerase/dehydratase [Polyangiaceae bacterium]
MRRLLNRTSQILLDLLALSIAFALAFFARFDWAPPAEMVTRGGLLLPYVVALQYAILTSFGINRYVWRYVGLREATRIFIAISLSSALLLLCRLVLPLFFNSRLVTVVLPLGVILINFPLAFLSTAGLRVARRLFAERNLLRSRQADTAEPIPTILVGAGQVGLLVAKELEARPDVGIMPIAFVDDDSLKHGSVLHGLPVRGGPDAILKIVRETGAQQVLITIANPSGDVIRRISELSESIGISVKIVPGLYELMTGSVNLSRIRSVSIEDLLRRKPVILTTDKIEGFLAARTVAVTGAGGSIGSELCRQICAFQPGCLVLVEQAENALFSIHCELARAFPNLEIVPCIADVCDSKRIETIFAQHRPSAVFHAAAHKHVPMMELNVGEAIKNNINGTRIVADAAHAAGVERFVLVSTDKAVNPSSVMGATKRAAELYIQSLSERSATRFAAVRFGNVLGSAGSVVPIFQAQIARGGPVTVTDPEMRRYFMTIPEACQLVLQAASMGEGGEIFVLDMGQPVKIVDLARDLIRLSGLRPDLDVKIVFTGVRPGEKLFEELIADDERTMKTTHPSILIGRLKSPPWESTSERVDSIVNAALAQQPEDALRERLLALVPEYARPTEDHSADRLARSIDVHQSAHAPHLMQKAVPTT